MRDSSVPGATPSVSAAPSGPYTRPRLAASASSIGRRSLPAAARDGRGGLGAEAGKLETAEAEHVSASEDHRALDDVLQLPDVPGPRIGAERGHGRSSTARIPLPTAREYRLAQYSARSGMSSVRSRSAGTRIGNTLRRKKRSLAEPPRETASSRFRLVAAITRASVRSVSLPPTRSNSRSWSTRSSATWTRRRQLPHLVEEDRPPGRQQKPAPPPLQRARERSSLVTQQLRGDEPLRQRGAELTLTSALASPAALTAWTVLASNSLLASAWHVISTVEPGRRCARPAPAPGEAPRTPR